MSIASEIQRINTAKANIKTAIENKGVTVGNGTIDTYADKIDAIQTGSLIVEEKDVNFYDYDGTLLYSYNASEFADLTDMPNNPTHDGLTPQSWNWKLSDAKAYVASYGILNIGQIYVTADGKTRIYITLTESRLSPYLGFAVDGTVTVNWGDGTTENITGNSTTTVVSTQHTYTQEGDYIITLESDSTIYLMGNNMYGSQVLWNNMTTATSPNRAYQSTIQKIELGNNINIGVNTFSNCANLKSITIPNNIAYIGSYCFSSCYNLKYLIIPNGVTSVEAYTFSACSDLKYVIFPNSITAIGTYAFQNCNSFKKITIPDSVTAIGTYAFQNCYSLSNLIFPNSITAIGTYAFQNCYGLKKITIPNRITSILDSTFRQCLPLTSVSFLGNITSIAKNAFYFCGSVAYYDFSNCTSVPTLSSTNAFSSIASDCKIIVPDDLYDEWKTKTNWTTYANYIIKESDWNA